MRTWATGDAGGARMRPARRPASSLLFSTTIVIVIVIVVAVTAIRTWDLGGMRFARPAAGVAATGMAAIPALRRLASADAAERSRAAQVLMIGAGAVLTVAALGMAWMARHVQVSTYGFLLLLGIGPLLLTWPTRSDHRGRFPYALAIVVAAVCALWAASLYAHNLGFQAATNIVRDLPKRWRRTRSGCCCSGRSPATTPPAPTSSFTRPAPATATCSAPTACTWSSPPTRSRGSCSPWPTPTRPPPT